MELDYFNKNWGPVREDEDATEYWNRQAKSYSRYKDGTAFDLSNKKVMARVVEECLINRDSLILDIGCGPGMMAQELAKTGAKLTGLDLAPAMIEIARQKAVEASLDIDYRTMDWVLADLVSLGWVKKFDVVMASRTPAIFNRQTLEKMMLVSSGYGVFISAVDINNSVRDILKKTLGWDETRARATRSSYMAWNILWLLGYYPQIFYQDTEWEDEVKTEEALITNRRFFEMSCGALTQEKVDMMTGALERISCNGLVLERVCSRTVVIIWKIRRTDSGDVK